MDTIPIQIHIRWPSRVTLGRLLPYARGLGFKPRRRGFPSGAKKEWGLSHKAKVRVLHTAQLDVTEDVDFVVAANEIVYNHQAFGDKHSSATAKPPPVFDFSDGLVMYHQKPTWILLVMNVC
uniref:Uncharacterized protein n=1 Tax=Tanacetum cinerariifolium TaxID=118510 RepID=A0A6L2JIL3_TANCI|nr:hypothetical protein [Tanacetum cinerariifolium]